MTTHASPKVPDIQNALDVYEDIDSDLKSCEYKFLKYFINAKS